MLVLRAFVRDGEVPLLGPPTSIGDFHHGVLYYYLLSPVAAVTGGDSPTAVLTAIALANVAAVVVVWWLARAIGGPLAGLIAGLLMAVSASAIEESTFIWNPNLIALSSAVAIAAAWRARATGTTGWWLVAVVAAIVTMHLHVLGVTLLPPLAALAVLPASRNAPRPDLGRLAFAAVALVAIAYLPLAVNELQNDFAETRAAVDFLRSGGGEGGPSLPVRLVFVALRIVSWPLTGLITDAPTAGLLAAGGVVAGLAWLGLRAPEPDRTFARWSAGTFAWAAIALALGARSLATVVPGLPNDHYHAFLDPVVFVFVGLALASVAHRRPAGPVVAGAIVVGLASFNLAIGPPPVSPDGGWARAEAAADRIVAEVGDRPFALLGLPALKSTDTYGYPLIRSGNVPVAAADAEVLVVLCDRLFEAGAIGASCGGPAEDATVAALPGVGGLLIRFDGSPRTVISLYALSPGG
jgi:hypothetical protein